MTKLFILLTGYLLFGQPTYSVAQKNVQLQHCCEKILRTGPWIGFTGDHNGKMRFRLLGVYSHGSTLFFLLRLNNRSPLDYDIDSIRFCVAETTGARMGIPSAGSRTTASSSSASLPPVYIYDSAVTIPGYRKATTIYALPRFTLAPGRRLLIIIRERNGGRHLQIQAGNATLERARVI